MLTKTLLPKKLKPQTTLITTKGVKILWQWKSAESCRLSLIEYARFCETCITLRFFVYCDSSEMNKTGSQFFCDGRLLRKLQIGQKLP